MTTQQREPAVTNPEHFEYVYYVNKVKHTKLLKDMSSEELIKIYRSLQGREKNYSKQQKDCSTKIKKLNTVMNNVLEVMEDIRKLDVEQELKTFLKNKKTALSEQHDIAKEKSVA